MTETQNAVQEAEKAAVEAKDALKAAKSERTAANAEHTRAEKAVQGKEGADLRKATAAVTAAKKKLDAADKKVTAATTARDRANEALKTARANERRNRPKLAKLTNSQRRAVCALEKAGKKGIKPETEMARTPFNYCVQVGYATESDGTFVVTDAGAERAKTIDISKYALPPKKERPARAEAAAS